MSRRRSGDATAEIDATWHVITRGGSWSKRHDSSRTEHGVAPASDGWFVVHAREAPWWHSDTFGSSVVFEGEANFPDVGIARRHHAAVETETSSARKAYAPYPCPARGAHREGTLPKAV